MQLAVALNLRNQSVTIEINNRSLDMSRESVDDNATVRVVTLVTLTYLPASFVSVGTCICLVHYWPLFTA